MAKILCAEDTEVLRNAVLRNLEQKGHEALGAANGAEALDLLVEHSDINLVITDIVMPIMDGYALIDEMANRGLTIPVIVRSADPFYRSLLSNYTGRIEYANKKKVGAAQFSEIITEVLRETSN